MFGRSLTKYYKRRARFLNWLLMSSGTWSSPKHFSRKSYKKTSQWSVRRISDGHLAFSFVVTWCVWWIKLPYMVTGIYRKKLRESVCSMNMNALYLNMVGIVSRLGERCFQFSHKGGKSENVKSWWRPDEERHNILFSSSILYTWLGSISNFTHAGIRFHMRIE